MFLVRTVPDPVTTAVKPAYFVLQIVNLPIRWFVLLEVKCRNCKINIAFLKFILGELTSKPPTQSEENEIFLWSGRLLVSSQQVAYWFVSWGRWIQFWQVHSVRLRYILISFYPHLGLKWCFPFTFSDYICMHISGLSLWCYVPPPSCTPWLDHPNNSYLTNCTNYETHFAVFFSLVLRILGQNVVFSTQFPYGFYSSNSALHQNERPHFTFPQNSRLTRSFVFFNLTVIGGL